MKRLKRDHGVECAVETSAVGESQSNGLAVGAVKDAEGLARAFKHAVEEMRGITMAPTHPALPWLVRHGAPMRNGGQMDSGGRSPCELRKGRPYKRPLPAFGENVFYLPVGK